MTPRLVAWPVLLAAAAALACGKDATAQRYVTPEQGSAERRDLLDALRPLAVWSFGAPIEFVVLDLRLAGDVAFASVEAQRPGGGAIDIALAPIVARDGEEPGLIDGPRLQALMQKSGDMWVPVQHSVGPTDVWYSWPPYCETWAAVLPEYCDDG
jgi:hypothetical protein